MDNSSWEEFESILDKVAWYGEVFKKAEGGTNWNKVGGISIYTTPWIDYYLHLQNGEFNNYCDELTELNLAKGESDIVVERLGQLVKELEGVSLANEITNIKVSIEAYRVGNIKDGLNNLLLKNITLHDFWTSEEVDKFVILRVNNYKCMSILKANYTNITHSLQSQKAKEIKVLKAKVQEYEDSIKEYKSEKQLLKYESKRSLEDLAAIRLEKRELYDKNTELSKQIFEYKESLENLREIVLENEKLKNQLEGLTEQVIELKAGIYTSDDADDLPKTTTFKMVLLYRLGILEANIWPEATRYQIGRVLGKIIGEEKYETVGKYKEHLTIGTSKGQTMLDTNDPKVEAFLKTSFKDFNLKKQRFIMHLEKKKK